LSCPFRSLCLVALALAGGPALAQSPIPVEARPVVVDPAAPRRTRFGRVRLAAALELRSPDPRLGGISGLTPLAAGRLLAVSDRGDLFELALARDRAGRLKGVSAVSARALPRPAGRRGLDVESIARDRDGSYLCGVEDRPHRLLRYRDLGAAPVDVALPPALAAAPPNGGLEAVTVLADGRLLLLCERCDGGEVIRGWLGRASALAPISLRREERFVPTDLAPLPDGGALLLERDYTPARGARSRVRRLPPRSLRAGASAADGVELVRLERPLAVDNFEGIALVAARPLRFVIVSDDNFDRRRQRTLLFELELP
jgi:hypothetical protein